MTKTEIQQIIDDLSTVSDKRQYWLVRTMGGQYYEDFVQKGFIAIGYDQINLSDIAAANTKDNSGKQILASIVKKTFPKEPRPNYIAKQLLDFSYNLKKGDIVIIPSSSSDRVSIGQVTETPVFIEQNIASDDNKVCPFEKRKKIKWHKTHLWFDRLDPKLLHLKYTRRTVTQIDPLTAGIIDRLITPIFVKQNDAHLSLDVRQQEPIKAAEMFETWLELFQVAEDFGKEHNLEIHKNDYEAKINVQSPGTIEFISYSIIGIVTLSTIVAAIIGAEYEANTRLFKFKIKSEGLIKQITNYLNNKTDRKFKEQMIKKVQKMNISPDEIVKILEQLNKNN